MPKCLIVEHVAPEPPFAIAEAFARAGVDVDRRRVFDGDASPGRTRRLRRLWWSWAVPCRPAPTTTSPPGPAELALLAEALRLGVPTIGVCLGAQLLAVAAGRIGVSKGPSGPEIGWGTVELTPACAADPLLAELPARLEVMHWHGDTFDLPQGAIHLIENPTYVNQGFRVGDTAWGLQFHLEVDEDAVDGFLEAFAAEAASVDGGAAGHPGGHARSHRRPGPRTGTPCSIVSGPGAVPDPPVTTRWIRPDRRAIALPVSAV